MKKNLIFDKKNLTNDFLNLIFGFKSTKNSVNMGKVLDKTKMSIEGVFSQNA